jgi:hypothetical protein
MKDTKRKHGSKIARKNAEEERDKPDIYSYKDVYVAV